MMKRTVLFSLLMILAAVGVASAQGERKAAKTVTNADLEKYKQKRLQAEREYRENYEKWGFPSPEELEERQKADDAARRALAEKLRRERLEREQIRLEREYVRAQDAPDVYYIRDSGGYYRAYPFFYSGFYSSYPRHKRGGYKHNFNPYFRNGIGPVGGGFFGPRINPYQPNRTILNRSRIFTPKYNSRRGGIRNPR